MVMVAHETALGGCGFGEWEGPDDEAARWWWCGDILSGRVFVGIRAIVFSCAPLYE